MNSFPARNVIDQLRRQYPVGSRVELVRMNDPYSKLQPGDRGTVNFIDDIGTIFCAWDRGSSLGVVFGEDEVTMIEEANDD